MIRGIYTSATGMMTELNTQDVYANNLANASTVGFKRENIASDSFQNILMLKSYSKLGQQKIGALGVGTQLPLTYIDFSDADQLETGNPTDLALKGRAVFAVEGVNGIRYTRAGNFTINKDNFLVTQDGSRVLGKNGPIQLQKGALMVSPQGEISQNGQVVAQLAVYDIVGLSKQGESYYVAGSVAPRAATQYEITQGSLEQSNVSTIREMIQMISVGRTYDTNQKALVAQDEALGKAVNEIAK